MTPEAARFLAKARQCLSDATAIRRTVPRIAAREAYLAAYHAAEALLHERTGKIAKSHSGVRSEFARITRGEPSVDRSLSAFLGQAYELKSLSDYGTGDEAAISGATAEAALQTAVRFVECVANLIDVS